MFDLKEFFMAVRMVGILHIFYLQFKQSIHLPISVILLLTIGSLGLAVFSKSSNDNNVINHKIYNYTVFLAGMFVICNVYASYA
jgi:Na+/H+ antiporter NhaD/arsenite permease-like protein